jgi:hypothetical protein
MLFNKKGWDFENLKRFEEAIEFHKKASQLDPPHQCRSTEWYWVGSCRSRKARGRYKLFL